MLSLYNFLFVQSSGRNERYTFELKWFIPLGDILILEESNTEPRENSPANIVALKSQACTVRDQILLEERTAEDKVSTHLFSLEISRKYFFYFVAYSIRQQIREESEETRRIGRATSACFTEFSLSH